MTYEDAKAALMILALNDIDGRIVTDKWKAEAEIRISCRWKSWRRFEYVGVAKRLLPHLAVESNSYDLRKPVVLR